ncbi:hypothetical protein HT031_000181 [Scenedesmus sp. PABB004]|nr:hypothetical protein HT031_000181 [Scenedesmus sp. PABB004]
MGRTGRAKRAPAPAVVGATPLSNDAPFGDLRRGAAERKDDRAGLVAKVGVGRFFTAPPRTAVLERDGDGARDTLKPRSQAEGAPVGLGELAATIWANTPASKGGARDPAAGPRAALGHIMQHGAALEAGGAAAQLYSTDGFRAYADEMVWGVRAAGEADDATLEDAQADPLLLRERLRLLWRSWRKLSATEQRVWSDRQLAREEAAAVERVVGSSKAPQAKLRRAAGAVSTAERDAPGRAKPRKNDGWSYVPVPKHAAKLSKAAAKAAATVALAAEREEAEEDDGEEQEQEEEEEQERAAAAPRGGGRRDQKRKRGTAGPSAAAAAAAAAAGDGGAGGLDAQYRRAAALRFSRTLLAEEMRSWEEEDEEEEAAAAAGVVRCSAARAGRRTRRGAAGRAAAPPRAGAAPTPHHRRRRRSAQSVEELRRRREQAAAEAKAAAAAAAAAAKEQAEREKAEGEEGAAAKPAQRRARAAGTAKAAPGKRKPAGAKGRARAAPRGRTPADAIADGGWLASEDGDDDEEEGAGPAEEAALARALSDGDDSDADASSGPGAQGDEEEEGQEGAAPPRKARKAAAARPRTAKGQARRGAAADGQPSGAKPSEAASRKRPAASEPGRGAEPAGAASGGKLRKQAPGGKAAAAKPTQQHSPLRRSARGRDEAQEEDGPEASGAGNSSVPVRRGRSAGAAGGAKVAQLEHLEMEIFSNTRRSSFSGRADSPGLRAAPAKDKKRPSQFVAAALSDAARLEQPPGDQAGAGAAPAALSSAFEAALRQADASPEALRDVLAAYGGAVLRVSQALGARAGPQLAARALAAAEGVHGALASARRDAQLLQLALQALEEAAQPAGWAWALHAHAAGGAAPLVALPLASSAGPFG